MGMSWPSLLIESTNSKIHYFTDSLLKISCAYSLYSTRKKNGAHSVQFRAVCTLIAHLQSTRLNGNCTERDGNYVCTTERKRKS